MVSSATLKDPAAIIWCVMFKQLPRVMSGSHCLCMGLHANRRVKTNMTNKSVLAAMSAYAMRFAERFEAGMKIRLN